MHKELVIPTTISDMVDARNEILKSYETANKAIKDAKQRADAVVKYLIPYEADIKMTMAELTKKLDIRFWRASFTKIGLFQVMDQKAMDSFDESLEKETPEYSLGNIRTTFLSMAADAEMIFERGLVNVFLRLSKKHVTNTKEPFKVSKKNIINLMVTNWYGMTIRYESAATVNDIDRVFKLLDGKKHIPQELENLINLAWKDGNIYEDEYYLIHGYMKGTMHITFKREDLLEKANLLIHKFYKGSALAA